MTPVHSARDSFIAVANEITDKTSALVNLLAKSGVDVDNSSDIALPEFKSQSAELRRSRFEALGALAQLQRMILGPTEHLLQLVTHTPLDLGTLRAIIKLDIPRAVPMGEPITFEDLAQRLKVDQDLLKRIIQYSVSNGIFCEDPPGYVQHTPASTAMMSDKLSYILHWSADICMASSLSMWEAIKAQNDPNSERKAAFNHALNTSDPLYEYLMKDNVLAAIFKKIVSEDFAINEINPTQVATAYNWSKLGKGTVVDVGGSVGIVSMAVARLHPNLRFIVQDLPETIQMAREEVPPDLQDRVIFQSHDFFTPQKVKADAFYLRFILHNWSDADVERIIHNLRPSFRHGTKLLINERVVRSDVATGSLEDKSNRIHDLGMMILFNAQERTLGRYQAIITKVEPRLSYVGLTRAGDDHVSVMEWEYLE